MTRTAKPPLPRTDMLDRAEAALYSGYHLAPRVYLDADNRPDRLADVEHPEDVHRPSNCEYAGMGDHAAENCPAGGV